MRAPRWPGTWLWPVHGPAVGATLIHEPPQSHDPDRNGFVRYRGRFDVTASPPRATLWLSADGRYLAFLNGQRLGRGPAASDADVREVDRYDVSALIHPGPNVLAALVHSYGVDTAWYTRPTALAHSGRGGGALYAHIDLDGRLALATPSEWRCLRAADWASDTPRVNGSLGFVEMRDTRLEPHGWEDVAFDDSGWGTPEPCAPDAPALPGRTYFPVLRPRAVPLPRERETPSVSWSAHEVSDTSRPGLADILTWTRSATLGVLARCDVDGIPGPPLRARPLRIRTADGGAVVMRFDFGKLVAARPRIEIDGAEGVVVDIVTAERLDGDGRPIGDIFGSRHGHRFILRGGPQSLERWDWIGLRYLFVTVRGAGTPVTITSVAAVSSEDPTPRLGEFACSDEILTGVWTAGARTLDLTATDLIHSDVAREHRQWVGDAQAALGAILASIGDAPVIRQALRQVAEAEPFAGFLPMYAPGDYRAVGTTIPDFTLRWLLAVDEHHQWSGDTAFVDELYPVVRRSIRAFDTFIDEGGLVADIPYWHFIDWAAVGRDGSAGPINALYILALQAASRLAVAVGDARETARLRRSASRARAALRARLRMPRGLFADTPTGPVSQHTNALAILSGAAPPRSVPSMAAAIGDRSRLRVTEAGRIVPKEDAAQDYDRDRHIVMAQPGFMGFVLRALATARRGDLALDLIRERWGTMAQSGTCWETWSGRHSRCHPWATAPTAELPRIVLGVAALERGWKKLRVDPFIGDLEWARGRVPTPRGVVGVSWMRDGPGAAVEVELPEGVVAELRGGELLGTGKHDRRLAGPDRNGEGELR